MLLFFFLIELLKDSSGCDEEAIIESSSLSCNDNNDSDDTNNSTSSNNRNNRNKIGSQSKAIRKSNMHNNKNSSNKETQKDNSESTKKQNNNNVTVLRVSIDEQWMQRFLELKEYQKEYGNCDVNSALQSKFSALAKWVLSQKQQLSKLTPEQIDMLQSIGCGWLQVPSTTTTNKAQQQQQPQRGVQHSESIWEECIAQLKEFRRIHGHVNIPRNTHSVLATWVDHVRLLKKENRLHKGQIKQLKAAGFVWSKWQVHFEALQVFVQKEGHCHVPASHPLYKWVQLQKKAKDKRADRFVQLNSIGFPFEDSDDDWAKSVLFENEENPFEE